MDLSELAGAFDLADADRMVMLLKGALSSEKLSGLERISEHAGVPIVGYDKTGNSGKALVGDVLFEGHLDWVRGSIDRSRRNAKAATSLVERCSALGKRYDAWILSPVPLARLLDAGNPGGESPALRFLSDGRGRRPGLDRSVSNLASRSR